MSFTLEKFGKLDFLVNNGGGQFPCGAADMSLKGQSPFHNYLRLCHLDYCLARLERRCRDQPDRDIPDVPGGPQAAHGGARGLHRQHHRRHVPGLPHDVTHRSGDDICHTRSSNVYINTGAARAGIDNLTKSLCVEWAGDGVRLLMGCHCPLIG